MTNKCDMVAFIADFWTRVMTPNGVTLDECSCYLDSLLTASKVRAAFPLL